MEGFFGGGVKKFKNYCVRGFLAGKMSQPREAGSIRGDETEGRILKNEKDGGNENALRMGTKATKNGKRKKNKALLSIEVWDWGGWGQTKPSIPPNGGKADWKGNLLLIHGREKKDKSDGGRGQSLVILTLKEKTSRRGLFKEAKHRLIAEGGKKKPLFQTMDVLKLLWAH